MRNTGFIAKMGLISAFFILKTANYEPNYLAGRVNPSENNEIKLEYVVNSQNNAEKSVEDTSKPEKPTFPSREQRAFTDDVGNLVKQTTLRHPDGRLRREIMRMYNDTTLIGWESTTYRYDAQADLVSIIDSISYDGQDAKYITKRFKDRTEVYMNGEQRVFNKGTI